MVNIGAGLPEGFWVHSVAESKNYLFLTLNSFKRPKIFALFDKESGEIELLTIAEFDSRWNHVFLKKDHDFLTDFPVFSKSEGHIFYSGECLYSVLEAKYFSETYGKATEESKNSSEYLRNMRPVFGSVNEFSNPVIMRVYLKQNTKAGLYEKMAIGKLMLKNRHKRKLQTTIMVIHILIHINAEREGQLKSRELAAGSRTTQITILPCAIRPLPCASCPDLSRQAGSSLKLPTGQFLNGRPFNRKEVYWQR